MLCVSKNYNRALFTLFPVSTRRLYEMMSDLVNKVAVDMGHGQNFEI